jgi:hypothetical protein
MNTANASTKSKWVRGVVLVLLVLAVLWGTASAALYRIMRRPPEAFARVMAKLPDAVFLLFPFETMWTQARAGTLQPGDPAPNFTLTKLDHSDTVQLAALVSQKPVVLIFGSYT